MIITHCDVTFIVQLLLFSDAHAYEDEVRSFLQAADDLRSSLQQQRPRVQQRLGSRHNAPVNHSDPRRQDTFAPFHDSHNHYDSCAPNYDSRGHSGHPGLQQPLHSAPVTAYDDVMQQLPHSMQQQPMMQSGQQHMVPQAPQHGGMQPTGMMTSQSLPQNMMTSQPQFNPAAQATPASGLLPQSGYAVGPQAAHSHLGNQGQHHQLPFGSQVQQQQLPLGSQRQQNQQFGNQGQPGHSAQQLQADEPGVIHGMMGPDGQLYLPEGHGRSRRHVLFFVTFRG